MAAYLSLYGKICEIGSFPRVRGREEAEREMYDVVVVVVASHGDPE